MGHPAKTIPTRSGSPQQARCHRSPVSVPSAAAQSHRGAPVRWLQDTTWLWDEGRAAEAAAPGDVPPQWDQAQARPDLWHQDESRQGARAELKCHNSALTSFQRISIEHRTSLFTTADPGEAARVMEAAGAPLQRGQPFPLRRPRHGTWIDVAPLPALARKEAPQQPLVQLSLIFTSVSPLAPPGAHPASTPGTSLQTDRPPPGPQQAAPSPAIASHSAWNLGLRPKYLPAASVV